MNEFKKDLAYEIASQIDAVVLDQNCFKCGGFLLEKNTQAVPFCWECTTARIVAHRGRTLLTMAKLKNDGVQMYYTPPFRHRG